MFLILLIIQKHMHYLVDETARSTHLMFRRWKNENKKNRLVINPDRDMTDITLDVIGKVNFGYDLGIFTERKFDPKKHEMSFFDALTITSTLGLLVQGRAPEWLKPLFKKTMMAIKETKKYMQELIDDRVQNIDSVRHDLLSLLVESNMNHEASEDLNNIQRRLTENELISDVFIFLLAGHETSTTTLQWILYELALNLDVQQKAHQEVLKVIGDRDPVYDDYDNLVYIKCIMNETLRLHSPVVMVPKITRKAVKLGGFDIPKDTPIDIAIQTVQTDEKYWDQPYKWMPERFEEEYIQNDKKRHACAFIPFSTGARRCIGNTFSQIETVIIVAMILQKYEVVFPSDDDKMNKILKSGKIPTTFLVTKKPKYLRVELKERK
jgi:cytochrome P450